jgi:hypothetical protein
LGFFTSAVDGVVEISDTDEGGSGGGNGAADVDVVVPMDDDNKSIHRISFVVRLNKNSRPFGSRNISHVIPAAAAAVADEIDFGESKLYLHHHYC